ncbi:MAG: hypothetical protein ACLFVJ_14450 [Persicimonas sp.]
MGPALLVALLLVVSSAVTHAEVPLRTAEAGPALVEMGGWQIFAVEMSVDGPQVSFKDVQASTHGPNGWTMSADRLDLSRAPSADLSAEIADGETIVSGEIVWMRARGNVRVSRHDDLYVTADQAVTVQPRRTLRFVDAGRPPTAGAATWRLAARSIFVQLASGRVEYDRPITGPARPARAHTGGITRRFSRNITGASSDESAREQEPRTKNREHLGDREVAVNLTGVESTHHHGHLTHVRHLNTE